MADLEALPIGMLALRLVGVNGTCAGFQHIWPERADLAARGQARPGDRRDVHASNQPRSV